MWASLGKQSITMSYAGTLALHFFNKSDFESIENRSLKERDKIIPRNALRLLMMGWDDNWKQLSSWRLFKAIFIKRDKYLMRGMRHAFQEGFDYLYEQLSSQPLDELQLEQAQLYLANCLSLLPFSDLNPHESITIPQYIDGHWQRVEYKVTPIELTPTSGFKKQFIYDEDRVFAYGLEPITNKKAKPHLIFMGTTYPAGQGFVSQVNTDLEAFETVGKKLYRTGRKKIIDWLKTQPKKAHVCGMSLGGSLALLLAIDQGDELSRVDAHNPAGLYEPRRKSRFDNWDSLKKKPPVIIQKQGNDPVSRFGIWKDDWTVLHVIPPESLKGPHDYFDHALNYAGHPETQFTKVDTKADNLERKQRNFWLYTLLRSGAYYFGLVPYRYLVRPFLKYLENHKLQLSLFVALTVLFCFLPILGAGIPLAMTGPFAIPFLILNAAISAFLFSFITAKAINLLDDARRHGKDSSLHQFIDWIEKSPLWKKALFGLSAIALTGLALSIIFVPALSAAIAPFIAPVVLAASIPLIVNIGYRIYQGIKALFGVNEVEPAKLHKLRAPRNDDLDIYNNKTTSEFSYKQLHDYFYAKRVILKNKPFVSDDVKTTIHFESKTKKQILETCQKNNGNLEKIQVTASKAKLSEMNNTLNLVKRFGLHTIDKTEFIEHLNENHKQYHLGK
jgi:hypothetical protein